MTGTATSPATIFTAPGFQPGMDGSPDTWVVHEVAIVPDTSMPIIVNSYSDPSLIRVYTRIRENFRNRAASGGSTRGTGDAAFSSEFKDILPNGAILDTDTLPVRFDIGQYRVSLNYKDGVADFSGEVTKNPNFVPAQDKILGSDNVGMAGTILSMVGSGTDLVFGVQQTPRAELARQIRSQAGGITELSGDQMSAAIARARSEKSILQLLKENISGTPTRWTGNFLAAVGTAASVYNSVIRTQEAAKVGIDVSDRETAIGIANLVIGGGLTVLGISTAILGYVVASKTIAIVGIVLAAASILSGRDIVGEFGSGVVEFISKELGTGDLSASISPDALSIGRGMVTPEVTTVEKLDLIGTFPVGTRALVVTEDLGNGIGERIVVIPSQDHSSFSLERTRTFGDAVLSETATFRDGVNGKILTSDSRSTVTVAADPSLGPDTAFEVIAFEGAFGEGASYTKGPTLNIDDSVTRIYPGRFELSSDNPDPWAQALQDALFGAGQDADRAGAFGAFDIAGDGTFTGSIHGAGVDLDARFAGAQSRLADEKGIIVRNDETGVASIVIFDNDGSNGSEVVTAPGVIETVLDQAFQDLGGSDLLPTTGGTFPVTDLRVTAPGGRFMFNIEQKPTLLPHFTPQALIGFDGSTGPGSVRTALNVATAIPGALPDFRTVALDGTPTASQTGFDNRDTLLRQAVEALGLDDKIGKRVDMWPATHAPPGDISIDIDGVGIVQTSLHGVSENRALSLFPAQGGALTLPNNRGSFPVGVVVIKDRFSGAGPGVAAMTQYKGTGADIGNTIVETRYQPVEAFGLTIDQTTLVLKSGLSTTMLSDRITVETTDGTVHLPDGIVTRNQDGSLTVNDSTLLRDLAGDGAPGTETGTLELDIPDIVDGDMRGEIFITPVTPPDPLVEIVHSASDPVQSPPQSDNEAGIAAAAPGYTLTVQHEVLNIGLDGDMTAGGGFTHQITGDLATGFVNPGAQIPANPELTTTVAQQVTIGSPDARTWSNFHWSRLYRDNLPPGTPLPTTPGTPPPASWLVPGLVQIAPPAVFTPSIQMSTTVRTLEIRTVPTDPIAIDLDGDGFSFLDRTAGIVFDGDADGYAERTGWIAGDDGLLVHDRNGDGLIADATEVISEHYDPTATDSHDALARLDENGDGIVDAKDSGFAALSVWQDKNQNGRVDAGELHSLADLGITGFNLAAKAAGAGSTPDVTILKEITVLGSGPQRAAAVAFAADDSGIRVRPTADGLVSQSEDGPTTYTTLNPAGVTVDMAAEQADIALGGRGDDTILGSAGNDIISGREGRDKVSGGAGNDWILFDATDDYRLIDGGAGLDVVQAVGDTGVDIDMHVMNAETAIGTDSGDLIRGRRDFNNVISGRGGRYYLLGGAATDVLTGDDGDDVVHGAAGNDHLKGGRGRDRLLGGQGADWLDGGKGNDTLDGGTGFDSVQLTGSRDDYRFEQKASG